MDEVLSRDRAALRRQLDRTLAPELLAREERAPILVALLEQAPGGRPGGRSARPVGTRRPPPRRSSTRP